jgi:hypothetical protein
MKFSKKQAVGLAARKKGYTATGANPKHTCVMPGSQNRKKGYGKRSHG